MQTLGIVFTGREQLDVRELEVPPLEPGLVLVEASKTLISTGTECICYQRRFAPGTHFDNWVKYPFSPGYSVAGRIVAVGDGVTQFKPGDRVASVGNHQKLSLSSALTTFPIPEGISDEEAAWATLVYITQHGFRKPEVVMGENVIVIGAGLLGQLIVQYARVAGAGEVIVIDPAQPRLDMAAAHGATHTLRMGAGEAREAIHRITGGKLADVVFDMTGHAQVFAAALAMLRKQGRLALIGDTGTPAEQHLTPDVIRMDLRIFGAHAGNSPNLATEYTPWSKQAMVALFFRYLQRGQMRVSDLITHRFKPQQAADAYRLLTTQRDEAMGVVFDFD